MTSEVVSGFDENGKWSTSIRKGLGKTPNGDIVDLVAVKDANISTTRHNRYLELPITATTWPGDDTFSVTWEDTDGVTRYRVKMESVTAGTKVKVAEDAVNEAQAEAWLADAVSSQTADVNHFLTVNSEWSEWQDFPEGYALGRLDFLGDTAEAMNIMVEAE